MDTQLHLIEPREPSWRIDERTCQIGRRGIAAAREALRRAPAPSWAEAAGDVEVDLADGRPQAA